MRCLGRVQRAVPVDGGTWYVGVLQRWPDERVEVEWGEGVSFGDPLSHADTSFCAQDMLAIGERLGTRRDRAHRRSSWPSTARSFSFTHALSRGLLTHSRMMHRGESLPLGGTLPWSD